MPLVAVPELPFADLDVTLESLGWFLLSESQTPPIIPGEPELAVYTHRRAAARLTYTFNPVVRLRVLAFDGDDAIAEQARVAARIDLIDGAALRRLLGAVEVKPILLGLFTAGVLRDRSVLAEVERLAGHRDPGVARAAAHARDALRSLAAAGPS